MQIHAIQFMASCASCKLQRVFSSQFYSVCIEHSVHNVVLLVAITIRHSLTITTATKILLEVFLYSRYKYYICYAALALPF